MKPTKSYSRHEFTLVSCDFCQLTGKLQRVFPWYIEKKSQTSMPNVIFPSMLTRQCLCRSICGYIPGGLKPFMHVTTMNLTPPSPASPTRSLQPINWLKDRLFIRLDNLGVDPLRS